MSSPLDPLGRLVTTLAVAIGGAALATLSTVMFLRWLGLHWTAQARHSRPSGC